MWHFCYTVNMQLSVVNLLRKVPNSVLTHMWRKKKTYCDSGLWQKHLHQQTTPKNVREKEEISFRPITKDSRPAEKSKSKVTTQKRQNRESFSPWTSLTDMLSIVYSGWCIYIFFYILFSSLKSVCYNCYGISALIGHWSSVFIRRIIYHFKCVSFDNTAFAVSRKVGIP